MTRRVARGARAALAAAAALVVALPALAARSDDAGPAATTPGRRGGAALGRACWHAVRVGHAVGYALSLRLPLGGGGVAPARAPPRLAGRVSLAALMREDVRSGRIRRTEQLRSVARWTSWAVTYPVNGRTVSGELLVPTGAGPFPAVVLNHGYIDPVIYTLGRGLSREQEWLASNGFVVLHTDYGGHAASDPVSDPGRETRLVYTRDAIGAVGALRLEPSVDTDRLARLGRSMGGGITQNALVAKSGLVDAAVVFASVSSRFVDNLQQFTEPHRPEGAEAFYRRFGRPGQAPAFYRGLSPRSYFDRIAAPVLVHHGTADETCPVRWSRRTNRLMRRAGVETTLATYADGHAFGPAGEAATRRGLAGEIA